MLSKSKSFLKFLKKLMSAVLKLLTEQKQVKLSLAILKEKGKKL